MAGSRAWMHEAISSNRARSGYQRNVAEIGLEHQDKTGEAKLKYLEKANDLAKEQDAISERRKRGQDVSADEASLKRRQQLATVGYQDDVKNADLLQQTKLKAAEQDEKYRKSEEAGNDAVAMAQLDGFESVTKKREADAKLVKEFHSRETADGHDAAVRWMNEIGRPQAEREKAGIDAEERLKDLRSQAQATSIAAGTEERRMAAEGRSGESRRAAEIRKVNEAAVEARQQADEAKKSGDLEGFARLDKVATEKEGAAAALPGILDIESRRRAEDTLAEAQSARIGMYDAEAGKVQALKDKYDVLIKAAGTPEEKAAFGQREQVEMDEINKKQREATADIRERTKEENLRLRGQNMAADMAKVEYEYKRKIGDEQKALAPTTDPQQQAMIRDRIEALKDEEDADKRKANRVEATFSSPMAAWEAMQKFGFTPPVGQHLAIDAVANTTGDGPGGPGNMAKGGAPGGKSFPPNMAMSHPGWSGIGSDAASTGLSGAGKASDTWDKAGQKLEDAADTINRAFQSSMRLIVIA